MVDRGFSKRKRWVEREDREKKVGDGRKQGTKMEGNGAECGDDACGDRPIAAGENSRGVARTAGEY